MLLEISVPEGAQVEIKNGKVCVSFNEKDTRRLFWKAKFDMQTKSNGVATDEKTLYVTHNDKLKF